MNPKALIPLVIGLGIAGVAAKLGFDFIKKAQGNQAKMVTLWTPVENIPRGMAIDKSMLKPLPFPESATPHDALADAEKIFGRVPHTGAPAGLPILNSMLLPPGASAGLRVPDGYRAVAVKIDESSGVDNHLEPGRFVDVVGVFSVRRGGRSETIARTIIENVEVAAVGERVAPSAPEQAGADAGKKSSAKRGKPPRAVTLLVKPSQAPTLHLAEQKGKIKLCMRGVKDEGQRVNAPAVVEAELFGEVAKSDSKKSWGDQFDDFVGSLSGRTDEPQPEPEPGAVQIAQKPPTYGWRMRVFNGDELRVIGWRSLDDKDGIVLSAEGPNIFQDEPKQKGPQFPPFDPARARSSNDSTPSREAQLNPPAPAEPEPDSDSPADGEQSESEPEELFE